MSLTWKPCASTPRVLRAESCLVRVAEDGEIRPCLWRVVFDKGWAKSVGFFVHVVPPLADFLLPATCGPYGSLAEAQRCCQIYEDAFAEKGWLAFADQIADRERANRLSKLQASAKMIEAGVAAKRAANKE
jgi:hypothetical protein